jgi:hypothetical protein
MAKAAEVALGIGSVAARLGPAEKAMNTCVGFTGVVGQAGSGGKHGGGLASTTRLPSVASTLPVMVGTGALTVATVGSNRKRPEQAAPLGPVTPLAAQFVPRKAGVPAGDGTMEFTCTPAGRVNVVPGLLVVVSIGAMTLLLEHAAFAAQVGAVAVVTRTVLAGVPVTCAVTTSSLKTGWGGTKFTLHDGGRQAAVISENPGAMVPTVPRLTFATAGWELNQVSATVLLSGTPLLSITIGARFTVEPTGALNEVLLSLDDF